MSAPSSRPVYFARCLCGCGGIVAATVDDPKYRKDTAEFVGGLILDGYTVERATAAQVNLSGCTRPPATTPTPQISLLET